MRVLKKIVLTGGPCAGKTSALSLIPEYFAKYGWKVVTLPEGATTLRLGGVFPDEFADELKFQEYLVSEQLARENVCEHFCTKMKAEKVLIVCDRGVCDGKAYVPEGRFSEIMRRLNLTETAVRDRYDAVFHLVTAADGAESAYSLSNNAARFENAEQAREADIRTQNAWVGHSHFRIIKNIGSFDDKMRMLMKEISTFLGEPELAEILRRFEAGGELVDGLPFKNITVQIIAGEEVLITKTNAPMTYFVIHHPKLVAAIENYRPVLELR